MLLITPSLLWAESPLSAEAVTVDAIVNARLAGEPAPLTILPQPLAIDEAYRIQTAVARKLLKGRSPTGYKAALTSLQGQQKFLTDKPLSAILFPGGELKNRHLSSSSTLMLELEVGYRLSETIEQPLQSVAELKPKIAELVAVIELPKLSFDSLEPPTAADLVATDVAAHAWLVGGTKPLQGIDPNKIVTTLTRDGLPVMMGQGSDTLGDQWQALLWLINHNIANGWVIEPGQLLITGATGKMLPALPGKYRADFAELGVIEFTIK